MSPPILIIGAGALGQSFAALLAVAGQSVTLFATQRSADRLRAAGHIVLRGAVDVRVELAQMRVTSDPTEIPSHAIAVFTTKGQDLPSAIATLANADLLWAAGVQNGVQKDDLLTAAFGPERVVGAATIFGGTRQDDGAIRVGGRGMTYFGELDKSESQRAQAAATVFSAAGIPAEAREDMPSVLWSKACNATGVFGICVLARSSNARLFSDPDLMRAYLSLVRETAAVARAYAAPVGNYAGFPPIRDYAEHDERQFLASLSPAREEGEPSYASMTYDLLAGRPMEVDAIFGDIVERAERRGVAVPCLRLVRDVLRGLNRQSMSHA